MRMILIYKCHADCYISLIWTLPQIVQHGGSKRVYVCLCNALTDREIRTVCQQQQRRVSDVYKALGCAAKCGKCVPIVRDLARIDGSVVSSLAEAA